MRHFISGNLIAFDTETTGLHHWQGDKPYAFSFCNEKEETCVFEFDVDPYTREPKPVPSVLQKIKRLLEDPKIAKVGHHLKFDARHMERAYGIRLRGMLHDTLFSAHACNSLEESYRLKYLGDRYVDFPPDDEQALLKATQAARRYGKSHGWSLGHELKLQSDDTYKQSAAVPSDYWMLRAVAKAEGYPRSHEWWHLLGTYAIGDVIRTMRLHLLHREALPALEGAAAVYRDEMRLWPITYRMEGRGVRIRPDIIEEEIVRFRRQEQDAYEEVMAAAGKYAEVVRSRHGQSVTLREPFNVNSTDHIGWLIEQRLGLQVGMRTKSGKVECSAKSLRMYMHHPVVKALFRYKSAKKGMGSFLLLYKQLMMPDTISKGEMVLHPTFSQVGPRTRRYSCSQPNLQQVANAMATRSAEPLQSRGPFGPRKGYVWYHFDYSQLEVRIFADVSQEPTMLDAIRHGRDLHTECENKAWGGEGNEAAVRMAVETLELKGYATAPQQPLIDTWKSFDMTRKDIPKLSPKEQEELAVAWLRRFDFDIARAEESIGKKNVRNKAKMCLFAKLFGGGPNAVKDLLYVTYEEAKQFMDDYDVAFPHIVEYINEMSRRVRRDGYIVNALGHRINVEPDKPYKGCNYMVQGSAASFLKRAMVRTDSYLQSTRLDHHLLMTIHDELAFECNVEQLEEQVLRDLKSIMEDREGIFGVDVPVDIEITRERWDMKEKVKLVA